MTLQQSKTFLCSIYIFRSLSLYSDRLYLFDRSISESVDFLHYSFSSLVSTWFSVFFPREVRLHQTSTPFYTTLCTNTSFPSYPRLSSDFSLHRLVRPPLIETTYHIEWDQRYRQNYSDWRSWIWDEGINSRKISLTSISSSSSFYPRSYFLFVLSSSLSLQYTTSSLCRIPYNSRRYHHGIITLIFRPRIIQ